eukprot:7404336-Lingulodinium_polyedra.AAC.1
MSLFGAGGEPRSRVALLNRLVPGRSVALQYEGDPLWHEALLIAPSAEGPAGAPGWTWEILTPDEDRYDEALDGSDP